MNGQQIVADICRGCGDLNSRECLHCVKFNDYFKKVRNRDRIKDKQSKKRYKNSLNEITVRNFMKLFDNMNIFRHGEKLARNIFKKYLICKPCEEIAKTVSITSPGIHQNVQTRVNKIVERLHKNKIVIDSSFDEGFKTKARRVTDTIKRSYYAGTLKPKRFKDLCLLG
jgi:hypothetical protein